MIPSPRPFSTSRCQRACLMRAELLDQVVDVPVFLDELRDLRGRVDHGRVVAPAELLADLRQRAVGELAAEVHRDLARIDWERRSPVSSCMVMPNARRRSAGSARRRSRASRPAEDVFQHLLGQLHGHRPAGQRREGDDAREGALELADVRGDPARDEGRNLCPGRGSRPSSPSAQDGDARLEVGRLDVRDQAPLEAGTEPRLERGDGPRRRRSDEITICLRAS